MTITGWEQMARWWDERLGDEGDPWHRTLIDPPLITLVGSVSGQQILDLACGNGYLSRRFTREGAQVVGVDANAAIIELARAREAKAPLGITYHVADAAHFTFLKDNSFDVVVCNMALMDIADATGAIREVARVLKSGGRCIASISHPCFDKVGTSGWAIESIYPTTTIWRKMSHYRELAVAELPWLQVGDEPVLTLSYHRPLSWYFAAFREAGLVVATLIEPTPTEEFMEKDRQAPWIAEIPLHCIFEIWKIAR